MDHFDKYRTELRELGLSSYENLFHLVKHHVMDATQIHVAPASRPPEHSQLLSHFGGQPYFEKGESWPHTSAGKPLDFIFQVINNGEINLPGNIKVLQFFYEPDDMSFTTDDEGWLVKAYDAISPGKMIKLERPTALERPKYCEISFSKEKSLPDWEGIGVIDDVASKLSCVLNEEEPWESYRKAVEEITGKEEDYRSQLGGYPKWVQGASFPENEKGEMLPLLFQLDSESNAGLMWGDVGLVYIFYDPEKPGSFTFELQCH
jgi:uncharacterized protein YwqG